MEIKITDHIEPLFTTYYTLMGRNSFDKIWIHIMTTDQKETTTANTVTYDYYKLIEFELETYDDEELYKIYYRQKKLGRLID